MKKKKKKMEKEDRTQEKKGKKEEEKRVKGQKVRLWVPPCVFNYKNAIELWVMETENN